MGGACIRATTRPQLFEVGGSSGGAGRCREGWSPYACIVRITGRIFRVSRRSTTVALVATVVVIAALTLSPRSGSNDLQLHPFGDFVPVDAVENLLLFLPLGAALCLRRWTLHAAAATGLAFSASIELAQLVVPGRTTSIDDVIFNSLGTALGWTIVALVGMISRAPDVRIKPRVLFRAKTRS